jgi:chromate transporter
MITLIAKYYFKYREMTVLQRILNSLRPAVVAMVAAAGISILQSAFWGGNLSVNLANTRWSLIIIFGICIILLQKFKMNPVWVMILAGIMKVTASLIGG